jgi:hypothetical protein
MASHDFCPGCEKCDREYENHLKNMKKQKIQDAIDELRNVTPLNAFQSLHLESAIQILLEKQSKI